MKFNYYYFAAFLFMCVRTAAVPINLRDKLTTTIFGISRNDIDAIKSRVQEITSVVTRLQDSVTLLSSSNLAIDKLKNKFHIT